MQGAPLCKLACSVDDKHVWALDARGGVFVRNGISDTFPIGADWEFLAGGASQACIVQTTLFDMLFTYLSITCTSFTFSSFESATDFCAMVYISSCIVKKLS